MAHMLEGIGYKTCTQRIILTYVYESDIDLLLVLKKGKYAGYQAINLKYNIYKRLDRKFPIDITKDPLVSMKEPSVTLILEPIHFVNNQLAKGKYFFRDIRNEGILLYDTGEFVLLEAKDLPWSERKPIAQEEYECWFGRGKGLFIRIIPIAIINTVYLSNLYT
ncbi:hypothetical protein [Candidatus Tisiphia endosymbiont of Neophilaenus lineatus]|uniref:hypothetical protein n=1 Tax=Candidatus Tisiphia endosymbiont of Neophilaenus lineatus TaxID=3139336 RepID=UPI0035CBAEFE